MADMQSQKISANWKAVYIAIAAVMGILAISCLLFILIFGPIHGESDALKLIIAGVGMLFAVILFVCCFNKRDNTRQRNILAAVSVLLFINILLSGVLDVLDGTAGAGRLVFAIQMLVSVLAVVIQLLFWFYQCASLPKNRMQRFFTLWVCGIVLLYLVLLGVNPFTGVLFFVDASGQMIYSGEIMELILATVLYLSYLVYILPQRCPLKKKISVACFAFFPMLFIVISAIWYAFGEVYTVTSTVYIFMLLAAYAVFFGDYIESQDLLLRQKAEIAEQARKQTELQTALMLSQIQPHFLYNALTAIRNLCKNDPAEAYTSLGQFADYLRGNMDALGNGRIIPFEKELEHIKTYLMLEQMRFGDELQVEYDIRYVDFSLPALSVQPIVENAVRHGATMNESGGKVTIHSEKSDIGAAITVTDNGPGFDPNIPPSDHRSHLGLKNVHTCLTASGYGELHIDSTPGVGTAVTILIKEEPK